MDLKAKVIKFSATQASQARVVKISDELVELLRRKKLKKGYLFMTYRNEPFTKNKLRRSVDEFKVKGSYQGEWSVMDLRHSFAVNFLTQGGDIKDLQYILGHSMLQDTKRLYGEIVTQKLTTNFDNPNDLASTTDPL